MVFDVSHVFRLFQTIYYLKIKQIKYRIYYIFRNKWRKLYQYRYPITLQSHAEVINLCATIVSNAIYKNNTFIVLNFKYKVDKNIDWNYAKHGKLWTYNLTYFDYLQQEDMTKDEGLLFIYDFMGQIENVRDGMMPFPISLRGMNWIKFLTYHRIQDKKIDDSLYAQYHKLMDNIEYHILGNHLLENGFSLLFGAYYFKDEKFYYKAKKILIEELEEQILKDGAHFELSPMYHQIMLFRVLDCINLLQNNDWKEQELLKLLTTKAEIMLGWLNSMTYENGDIPLLNDSTNNIAPTTDDLNKYALRLDLQKKLLPFKDSGYRKVKNERYEMVMDVGNIGPDYIPGHAHSDTFNFELCVDGQPFIVDTGLSTYETNARRTLERSTASHNTVEVGGVNQSEVWGGFRVARRAKIIYLYENNNEIKATHDGYKRIGALHTRKFMTFDETIVIEDSIKCSEKHQGIAYIHFYPGLLPEVKDNKIIILDKYIVIDNAESIKIEAYQYAPEFNKLMSAYKIKINFTDHLKMEIKI